MGIKLKQQSEEAAKAKQPLTLKKKIMITAVVLAAIVVLCMAAFKLYAMNYYKADPEAMEYIYGDLDGVTVYTFKTGKFVQCVDEKTDKLSRLDALVFMPEGMPKAGVLFYPGGKVEYTAYAPLMEKLAEQGYAAVLVRMPENLAVFRVDVADVISPDDELDWYLCGHSLGGAMAGKYLSENSASFEGLILLAAYTPSDLSQTNLRVISIYGSEDGVINWDNFNASREYLPVDNYEYVIKGGCHSGFGLYGPQSGDNEPTITAIEQIETTALVIDNWIKGD